ncbi:uncharacterized protein LOC135169351 [Diachasmimorpha longicaudata]|uniref:uncharacterized protein LOC135169351 n=1 Tax=Diachasmimorpha longicaudata TaxID=58733 RepID=UPI0030B8DED5
MPVGDGPVTNETHDSLGHFFFYSRIIFIQVGRRRRPRTQAILTTDPNLVETLRLFMRVLISNKKEMKICVSTILSAVLRKTVSLHYSGYGKEAGGKKKKNFYNTTVCKVLIDVIIEVIGSSTDEKKIMSEVSTWLSRSGDREGGRKERQRGSSHHNENNSVCSFDTNR